MCQVYYPYLLLSKKRYAGLLHSSSWKAGPPESMDVKGLQNIRRDSCLLLRETYTRCLQVQ